MRARASPLCAAYSRHASRHKASCEAIPGRTVSLSLPLYTRFVSSRPLCLLSRLFSCAGRIQFSLRLPFTPMSFFNSTRMRWVAFVTLNFVRFTTVVALLVGVAAQFVTLAVDLSVRTRDRNLNLGARPPAIATGAALADYHLVNARYI